MYGAEGWLTPLVAQACIEVCPKNPANFNVDNVRVVKIPGSGADSSQLVRGVVVKREPEGTVRSAKKAKVAVFAQGIDSATTETKASSYSLANSLANRPFAPGCEFRLDHFWLTFILTAIPGF